MKNQYYVVKKSHILFVVVCVFLIAILECFPTIMSSSSPSNLITIVIDAGHGGIDGGTVGVSTGKDENYLNLQYALCLRDIMKNYNINIVMTRTNLNGLYGQFAENKKLDDMKKRKEIVERANADILISIHMNSFPLKSCKGAQVFYRNENFAGEKLASSIQDVFLQTLPNARQTALVGDYYMLNEFDIPSVIVECGYLSNEEEEKLLQEENYKKLVCSSIFVGVIKFLAM